MKKIASLMLTLFLIQGFAKAAKVEIPLDDIRVPSNDLWYESHILDVEEAFNLQNRYSDPVDLSKLDPQDSSVWKNVINPSVRVSDDSIPVLDNDLLNFTGAITSNSTVFRFNALPEKSSNNKTFTILMEKRLHTTLVRRNLLRKLGYVIPKMKYLKKIRVKFSSIEEKQHFLERQIPENTYGAASRWLVKELSPEDSLTITLQDVVVMVPSEKDNYNTAMGVPVWTLKTRTLRSLLVPYALVDFGESVNKIEWFVGKEDNNSIVLPHFFDQASFGTNIDDAKWAARRLEKLTRKDLEEVIKYAHFPKEVELLLIEKLVARRNYLLELLKVKFKKYQYNTEVSYGDKLAQGLLKQTDWPGYASRFAHGEADSPFQQFYYFSLAQFQSMVIGGLVDRVNSELSAFNPSEEQLNFHKKQFKEGLDHFVETGEFKEFSVGTWVSPVANGSLILSRDIVIGNYLGTDNMVQLADTFGYGVSLGAHVGFENVPGWINVGVRPTVSYVKTYTHLKPVKTLKATFKEPYKNIFASLIKLGLKKRFERVANFEEDNASASEEVREEAFQLLMNEINARLGVGESLIITTKLTPSITGAGRYSILGTDVSLGAGYDFAMVKRIHLYRKSSDILQIYEDRGRAGTLSISANYKQFVPIINLRFSKKRGKYKVKVHNINIDTDIEKNPKLYSSANAIFHLLENNSSELIEDLQKPFIIENQFKDKSTKFAFLVWRSKYLKTDAIYAITTPEKNKTYYLKATNESQSGINYEAFGYDVVNYYLDKYYGDYGVSVSVDRWQNPSYTFKGVSITRKGSYEARLTGKEKEINFGNTSREFISINISTAGWSKSKKKVIKELKKINKKYQKKLFSDDSINDAKNLMLFDISINISLYEEGVAALKRLDSKVITEIGRKYRLDRGNSVLCKPNRRTRMRTPIARVRCGNLKHIIKINKSCKKLYKKGNRKKIGKCLVKLALELENYLEFNDFKKIAGGVKNLFLYASVNGFRTNSEILNDPIISSTIGEVGDPQLRNGPLSTIRNIIGAQSGEFEGNWIRERL